MALNLELRDIFDGVPIRQFLEEVTWELERDLVGFWALIAEGRDAYQLQNGDLREFLVLTIGKLIISGAFPIVPSSPISSRKLRWAPTQMYGTTADEIALNVVREWNNQGEPDIEAWTTLAFAKQKWIDSRENQMGG